MNLTNSSEPMGDGSPAAAFKMEPPHDMLYYQVSQYPRVSDAFR